MLFYDKPWVATDSRTSDLVNRILEKAIIAVLGARGAHFKTREMVKARTYLVRVVAVELGVEDVLQDVEVLCVNR